MNQCWVLLQLESRAKGRNATRSGRNNFTHTSLWLLLIEAALESTVYLFFRNLLYGSAKLIQIYSACTEDADTPTRRTNQCDYQKIFAALHESWYLCHRNWQSRTIIFILYSNVDNETFVSWNKKKYIHIYGSIIS